MCTISGTCGCKGGAGTFLLALSGQVAWWLLKTLAQAVQLLVVALILTGKWAAPRGWRLARRGARGVHRWYVTRPVVLDREPVAAITDTTTALTLADLRLTKKEANAR